MKQLILKLIKLYQIYISPSFAKNCRFYPTCSEYTYSAIKRYGIFEGSWKGFRRILKCFPWHAGGIDLP